MLSIAFVSDAIYPFFKGGKEKRIHEITTRLAAGGHKVTIYTMKWWDGPDDEIVQDGITLKAISPYYPIYDGNRRSIREAVLFAFHCLKMIPEKFDVIEVDHMPHLVLFPMKVVCFLKRKRLIVTWHEVWGREYWNQYLGGVKGLMAYWVEAISAKLPDIIVSVSEHTKRRLATVLGRTENVVVLHNGLDIDLIVASHPATKGADVIFAGRLLSHKNVDLLLKAAKIVANKRPDLSVWIIGEGPERASLEALSKEMGLERTVSFLGFLEKADSLYSTMKASKMLVLPSTREGFGIIAVEANACGIPFITVDDEHNATRDLVRHRENGILVRPDAQEIAYAIEELLGCERRESLYREFAKQFDWNRVTSSAKDIYTSTT